MRGLVFATMILIAGRPSLLAQQTFTVTSTADGADATPGDGVCDIGNGSCTLRAAVEEANATAGHDTIAFAIGGTGPHIIQLTGGLPVLTDQAVIDGYTQPGASANTNGARQGSNADLRIVLDATGTSAGLEFETTGSTVRGLRIQNAGDYAIRLGIGGGNDVEGNVLALSSAADGVVIQSSGNTIGGGNPSDRNVIGGGRVGVAVQSGTGNQILNNLIGTDAAGTGADGNQTGIEVSSPSNVIGGGSTDGGNVISANGVGILIAGAVVDGTDVRSNLIGTDVTGTVALGNTTDGVRAEDGLHHFIVGNVIAGNGDNGIALFDNADSAIVIDNYIGVDITGMSTLNIHGNTGIAFSTSGHTIGGTTSAEGNVIAGHDVAGMLITGHEALIQGNLIGTNAGGTQLLGNDVGIVVQSGSSNQIGGLSAGAGNVIAGSGQSGIVITGLSPGNVLQGNFIGTDALGADLNLGNGIGGGSAGVLIDAQNTMIERNTIAYSGHHGLLINGGTGNRVSENVIYSNAGLGIGLGATGVTPNDAGDGDVGPNNQQNFPLVTLAYLDGGTAVEGTFNSASSSDFTLEFFASGACDPADHGEGRTFLGSTMVTTGVGGDAGFTVTLSTAAQAGEVVTATATDATGNTSEFSPCVRVGTQPTFVVTATDDATDGVCSDGHCSLREAVLAANARPGADTIHFDIAGAGPHVIQPATVPTITDPVVIDGYTQPDASPNTNGPDQGTNAVLMVVIDAVNTNGSGLDISAGNSTVRGLVIHNAGDFAIRLFTGGGNTIEGNFLGTDHLATNAVGQSFIVVELGSPDNTIGGTAPAARNVIGSGGRGVLVGAGATGSVIQGNLIGVGANGRSVLNVQFIGVEVREGGTLVGGTVAGAGNVVSGGTLGISISDGAGTMVQGNRIGTDVTGTLSSGNQTHGVSVSSTATGTVIGGPAPAAGNVISGNGGFGIVISGSGVTGTVVQSNHVGTTAAGTAALPNLGGGVRLTGSSSMSSVGDATAGNLISGNAGPGVLIEAGAHDNVVQSNRIGSDAGGAAPLPNTASGIHIDGGSNNVIGEAAGPAVNTIAFNGGPGIAIVAGTGNRIRGNPIHSNGGLGIDLGANGITANDPGDADAGPNGLQNFGLVALAYPDAPFTRLEGTFHGAPNTQVVVEFFTSAACDPSDHGEGETFLGSTTVTTDGAGNATFAGPVNALSIGDVVTTTTTDPATGNTSEFSSCVTVQPSPAFAVSATDDADDGVCSTGHCTLREAIIAANARAGTETIRFAMPGAGPHTITLGASLPIIADPVVIDGYTQPGASPNTNPPNAGTNAVFAVVLDAAASGGAGLDIEAGNSTVRGLRIEGAPDQAIRLRTNGGNLVEGNVLLPSPGAVACISVESPGNVVGGTAPEARNVISGGAIGIHISAAATGTVIQGNLIGTDPAGTAAVANQIHGVDVGGSSTMIGGTGTGAGNVISGNGFEGINILGVATGVLVQGNLIGTDVSGTQALPNGRNGIEINSSASSNTIGGTAAGARNVISGNIASGVRIIESGVTDNVVQGNYIGTDITGSAGIPNGAAGITLTGNSSGTLVGGAAAGAGNTIAFNGAAGVTVTSSAGNGILGNAIHSNAGLGIDLGNDGVTPNDAADADAGPNGLQNFPVIDVAVTGSAELEGTFSGAPSASYRLEFFSSDACDGSGNGEGQRFLGAANVTTDASGNVVFAASLTGPASPGDAVSATATDGANNTSEFSPCATGVGYTTTASADTATTVRGSPAALDVTVTAVAGTLDADVALSCRGLPAGAACAFAPPAVRPAASAATSALTVSTADPATPAGAHDFTIVGSHGSVERTFDATLVVTDFTVAVAPASGAVARGMAAAYTVSVNPEGGRFDQAVGLTCTSAAAGSTCGLSAAQVTPGASAATATLTVTTDLETPTGAAAITVTGTAGALARSGTADIVVSDFTVALSPDADTIVAGAPAAFTVTVEPEGGAFAEAVALACVDLPAGASCAFAPATVTPGSGPATSTLTVSAANTVAFGAGAAAPRRTGAPPSLPFALLLVAGLASACRRTRLRGRATTWIARAGLCVALTGLACGDDLVGPGQAVTVTFTITGTSGPLADSTTATVTLAP